VAQTVVAFGIRPTGNKEHDLPRWARSNGIVDVRRVISATNPGTFTVAERNFVLINNSITLRGSGPGTTILTRTGGATLGTYIPGANPFPMIILGPQAYNNGATAIRPWLPTPIRVLHL
jgi:hypothetical protein